MKLFKKEMFVESKFDNRFERLSWLIISAAALVYLGNVYHLHLERLDDAYITFRFARHLANGEGLIWNTGGEPVEGYTSLLHVSLLAAGIKIGINPWVGSLMISLGSVLLTVVLILKILHRQFGYVALPAAVAVGIYLTDTVTAVHSVSGLETQLFVLVLAASCQFAFSFVESAHWSSAVGLAACVFLSCLCRPEAVIYAVSTYSALAYFAVGAKRKSESDTKDRFIKLVLSSGLVLIGGSLYAFWKYRYFGYLLPNPFYVKSNSFALAGTREVFDYLKHSAKYFAPLIGAAVFLIVADNLRERKKFGAARTIWQTLSLRLASRKSRAKLLLILLPPLLALGFYCTIIHEVGGAFRFSYPTYFYLTTAAAVLLTVLTDRARIKKGTRTTIAAAAIIWLAILFVAQKSWQIEPLPPEQFNRYHLQIAEALAKTKLGSQATVICDAAGIIPFVSDFNQIDRVGLTNNFLSGRTPVTPAAREAYLWNSGADVYIGFEPPAASDAAASERDANFQSRYVSEILLKRKLTLVESRIFVQDAKLLYARMRRLRDDWILVGELDFPGWQAWQLKSFAYVRRGSPHREILISTMREIIVREPERINLNDTAPQ